MKRLFAAALAIIALSGCAASTSYQQQRREAVARGIVDDTLAFNEAYHEAITSQILLNIMRAQNRQPRQYMSMSGFTQSGGSNGASITIGGIELDQIGESWGAAEFAGEASRRTAPDFTLAPFSTDAFANVVMRPTDPQLFRYYWDSGWNPDLLLMLIVDRVRIIPADGGAPRDLRNSAGTIVNDCTGDAKTPVAQHLDKFLAGDPQRHKASLIQKLLRRSFLVVHVFQVDSLQVRVSQIRCLIGSHQAAVFHDAHSRSCLLGAEQIVCGHQNGSTRFAELFQ